MLKKLFTPLLFLILSLIIGLVTWCITKNDFSYIVGFCSFITLLYIKIHLSLERNNNLYNRLIHLLENIKLEDNFIELSFFLNLKRIANFKNADIHVEKDKIHEFWYEYVSRVQNRFEVLTYAKPDETWNLGWNRIALGVQQDRIAHKCKIVRIFVLDNQENIEDYKTILSQQREIGIEIRWLKKEALLSKSVTKKYIKNLKTLDFGIIDNNWTVRTMLSSRRKMEKTIATKNNSLLENARKVFDEAYQLSTALF